MSDRECQIARKVLRTGEFPLSEVINLFGADRILDLIGSNLVDQWVRKNAIGKSIREFAHHLEKKTGLAPETCLHLSEVHHKWTEELLEDEWDIDDIPSSIRVGNGFQTCDNACGICNYVEIREASPTLETSTNE